MAFSRSDSVRVLPGVGEAAEKALAKLQILTLADLLEWYPRDYEDRRRVSALKDAPEDAPVCIQAVVARDASVSYLRTGRNLTRTEAFDDTGSVTLSFFNQPFLRSVLKAGECYTFYGRVERSGGRKNMTNPVFEREGERRLTGRLVPIYPLTAGVSAKRLTGWIAAALEGCLDQVEDELPAELRRRYGLADRRFAVAAVHAPDDFDQLKAARERLVFEELFYLTVGLEQLRLRRQDAAGCRCGMPDWAEFYRLLPFAPTGAQRRTLEEISADLTRGGVMNRLVQGDVGSGKTAVAAGAAWLAAQSGYQSAYMAPTEILARQHYDTMRALLGPAGIRVELLTASVKGKRRREVLQRVASGETQMVVGTHALLTEGVTFSNLGLAVTDEQHRFGVGQRAALAAKGGKNHPHVLVMSATPIPRTLALIVYGDLDVSVLDERPAGRREIETYLVGGDKRTRLFGFIRTQAAQGRQIYIVCPAVEDGQPGGQELKSVCSYEKELRERVFPDLRVGLVHGRLKPKEKEDVMGRFSRGELDVLVSTTVIEVGVDVPNATLMVVENAERFGLSQLHQLRGRVGRGAYQSYCVLVTDHREGDTRQRLKTLCRTNDGFQIAEEDLKQRGPGDFFGRRQHGLPQLRVADLAGDTRVLYQARSAAKELLAEDPNLGWPEHAPVRRRVRQLFRENPDIFN